MVQSLPWTFSSYLAGQEMSASTEPEDLLSCSQKSTI